MRLIAPSAPPMGVSRYLRPEEQLILIVRHHPALLIPSLTTALGGLLAAVATSAIPQNAKSPRLVVWILTAFLIVRCILAAFNWSVEYMALTNDRLLVVSGLFNRRFSMIAVSKLKEMALQRTTAGRLLGYGAFTIELDGKTRPVVDYIPYPDQVYLEVYYKISPQRSESEGLEPPPDS
jgi:uncharacterized membrane protein YdbT with pleckstrin-like domain